MTGRRGSRPRSASATAACPAYTSASDDQRRRLRGSRRDARLLGRRGGGEAAEAAVGEVDEKRRC